MALNSTPDIFPLSFDPTRGQVRCVRLSEADYKAASFLDERILAQAGAGEWVASTETEAVARTLSVEGDFIFHMGHVGSTLLSRVLATSDRVFSVREPAILRTLAEPCSSENHQARLESFSRLFARVWRPDQRALIKATSFVSDLGEPLMAAFPSAKAILMLASPVAYMSGMLAGSATRPELKTGASRRLLRLHRRLGGVFWRFEALSEGELAAMAWAGEVVALAGVAREVSTRAMWLDFDAFLARPRAALAACLQFLHGAVPKHLLDAMVASADFSRYSKAPEYAYSARLRADILAVALSQHRIEIARGMDWLDVAGQTHALIASATRAAAAGMRPAF